MQTVKYVYWQENGHYLGHFVEYPDYWTQGDSLDDLKQHLIDLFQDLTSGQISRIRKVHE